MDYLAIVHLSGSMSSWLVTADVLTICRGVLQEVCYIKSLVSWLTWVVFCRAYVSCHSLHGNWFKSVAYSTQDVSCLVTIHGHCWLLYPVSLSRLYVFLCYQLRFRNLLIQLSFSLLSLYVVSEICILCSDCILWFILVVGCKSFLYDKVHGVCLPQFILRTLGCMSAPML